VLLDRFKENFYPALRALYMAARNVVAVFHHLRNGPQHRVLQVQDIFGLFLNHFL